MMGVVEVELHDEVVEWLAYLTDAEWARVVVIVDWPADLGSLARMPLSRNRGGGVFELRQPRSDRSAHQYRITQTAGSSC